ncbi:pathogenesis-related thaumatin-like protein 3.5 isoform X1 [Diospyros lotus]|uniref:pathogenesis-related thaumatin-like protein 3.5 isoform X1 n=1 Tax=Diospyros lotus TaxID=55363 RepID=UPI002250A55F|nr:pathogenesis-related thaumatin-like protein 3.5 isoform X1 [Diospyros lotus]XP_052192489.1 pathogenesis-related thaumatin-like protein 3.5 isoform X1 [Diospyros lotus]
MLTVIPKWIIFYFFVATSLISSSFACTFTVTNNCPFTIWPGTLAGAGTPQLTTTGFQLESGQGLTIPTSPGWSGRIWARTGCTFDESGVGTCQTGDCGGRLQCDGFGATPPASLFEITLGIGDGKDFYDVSLVDGYNLPLIVAPRGVGEGCNTTGCVANINMGCPKELQVVGGGEEGGGGDGGGGSGSGSGVVACKSACMVFGLDQYCCTGEFANPTTCRPSSYAAIFKRACPRAYSFAFDDGSSTFTCKGYDYSITFCPLTDGIMRANDTILPGPPMTQQHPHGDEEVITNMVSESNTVLPFTLMWIIFMALAWNLF